MPLLDPTDSTEVDTFRRLKVIGDIVERSIYIYDKEHVTLLSKRILRVECEGYETAYYDLNKLPSEEKHGEALRDEKIQLYRVIQQTLGEAVVTASKNMMVMKGNTGNASPPRERELKRSAWTPPLLFGVTLGTDLNLFMHRGYSD